MHTQIFLYILYIYVPYLYVTHYTLYNKLYFLRHFLNDAKMSFRDIYGLSSGRGSRANLTGMFFHVDTCQVNGASWQRQPRRKASDTSSKIMSAILGIVI